MRFLANGTETLGFRHPVASLSSLSPLQPSHHLLQNSLAHTRPFASRTHLPKRIDRHQRDPPTLDPCTHARTHPFCPPQSERGFLSFPPLPSSPHSSRSSRTREQKSQERPSPRPTPGRGARARHLGRACVPSARARRPLCQRAPQPHPHPPTPTPPRAPRNGRAAAAKRAPPRDGGRAHRHVQVPGRAVQLGGRGVHGVQGEVQPPGGLH